MNSLKLVFYLFLLLSISVYAQTPFAQWAKLSSDAPKNITARTYPVPTVEQVGIPSYPGAVISSVSAPRVDTLTYEKEVLPFITLVSTKSPSQVISFYKGKLSSANGWSYSEELKTFVKGNLQSALTGFVPAVAIREENGENFDLVHVDANLKKKLKSRIEITYQPSNKKDK
ncbi:MAG: hypothetical protein KJN64_03525 [Ignavibacteria bacterium]|nr:hypothetical protein [Ignavibacteria bacterium]